MKRKSLLWLLLLLTACGGSLSDEQRKEMREKMEMNRIVRVTEAEIMEAAFAEGREVVNVLDSLRTDSVEMKKFLLNQGSRVRFLKPGESNARLLEQQLIDAYLADPSSSFQDNVQQKRNASGDYDSLLYTKPVTTKLPDGSERLEGVWNIWLAKRDLVLRIGRDQ